jgi:hypothetical protein
LFLLLSSKLKAERFYADLADPSVAGFLLPSAQDVYNGVTSPDFGGPPWLERQLTMNN